MNSLEKSEAGFPPPPNIPPVFVKENDRAFVNSKLTQQPVGTYLQPVKLAGAREKVAKKTYIRVPRFPSPAFDKALAECKADKSWSAVENTTSGHMVMLDEPQWLADVLLKAS